MNSPHHHAMKFPEASSEGPLSPDQETLLCTSNFASVKKLPPTVTPVSIAIGPPRWWSGLQELRLAPDRSWLKASRAGNQEYYDQNFFARLYELDAEEIHDVLTVAGTRPTAILCWCPRGNLCHRRYVAEWLEAHLEIVVPEFGMDRSQVETFCDWRDA